MNRAQVIHQCYRLGGGRIHVHKRHGGWRTITFDSGPGQLEKLLGLASVLARIGGATTAVVRDCRLVVGLVAAAVAPTPMVPRAGPGLGPVQIDGP
jgi:hypothetical protein